MGAIFSTLLDAVVGVVGSNEMKPDFVIADDSHAVADRSLDVSSVDTSSSALGEGTRRTSRAEQWRNALAEQERMQKAADEHAAPTGERIPTIAEIYGIAHPLTVFITPNYANEPPNNAMIGELGTMQSIAHMRNPDGSQAMDIARWIPSGPNDTVGRLVKIDPLGGARSKDIEAKDQEELHIRTDIDRVVAVIVRFPISEAQFSQIQTVFCTYGRPRLIADFSNAGLYMDMKYGPSARERDFGVLANTRPYSLKVLTQFDVVRVPNQRIADMIQREVKGAA